MCSYGCVNVQTWCLLREIWLQTAAYARLTSPGCLAARGPHHHQESYGCCWACRASADFLPIAFVLGLAPGKATEVPIVIVAEDGVTSLRYYLNIFRAGAPSNSTGSSASSWNLGSSSHFGGAGAPLGSLDLHSGGAGSDEKESSAPSVLSAKAARQPGIVIRNCTPR